MKFIKLVAVVILLSCQGDLLFSQNLPSYQERYLSASGDSLALKNSYIHTQNGSIDPKEYILGPGDRLFISVSGIQEIKYELLIDHEGYLFIPKIGPVNIKNLSFALAKENITAAINKSYKNVDIFISLIELKRVKTSLLGDVKKPGSYMLPGNSRLSDVIILSGCMTSTSNFRDIEIVNTEGIHKQYDILEYLRFGDKNNDPILKDDDAIFVDKTDKIISINGEVKYPGVYEFVKGETALDLINLAGGYLTDSRIDTIEIVRFEPDGKNQYSLYYSRSDLIKRKVQVNYNDRIFVRKIPDYYIPKYVEVKGWVKYPGFYKIVEDKTALKDIIEEAGGFRKDASLKESTLLRTMGTVEHDPEYERIKEIPRKDMTDDEYDYFKAKSRERTGSVVVDFSELFRNNNMSENVMLKRNDIIDVPEAKNYVTLIGQVVNPGNIIYKKELNVDDYIKLAGGFGWRAVKGDVRVVRSTSGEWIDAGNDIQLNPGDVIWIPENTPSPKFWDVFTTSLQIVGEVASIIAATVAIIVASRS